MHSNSKGTRTTDSRSEGHQDTDSGFTSKHAILVKLSVVLKIYCPTTGQAFDSHQVTPACSNNHHVNEPGYAGEPNSLYYTIPMYLCINTSNCKNGAPRQTCLVLALGRSSSETRVRSYETQSSFCFPSSMLQSYWSMRSPMHCSPLLSLSALLLLRLPTIEKPLISANGYSTTTCILRRSVNWYVRLPVSQKPLINESSPEHASAFFEQQSRSIVWPLSHFWSTFNTHRQLLLT